VGLEACVGAHHLGRRLQSLGHDVRLMAAKYVRPFCRKQKNDFNDAEAIAEAVTRPTTRYVALKTPEQLDLQALHRVRERLMSHRTGVINQIRAFLLERGIAIRQGWRALRSELPRALAMTDKLTPRMVHLVEDLASDWRQLDARIEAVSAEIEELAHADEAAVRLMSVPGIGPIISSATVAGIGKGDVFTKGRDFGAWLGIVPKQTSTGGRPILGRISRRKPLSATIVRAGRSRRAAQAEKLGALRPQALDRGCGPAAALQQARHRPCQQACPHRLGCSAVWWYFQNANGEQRCAPNRLMLATVLGAVKTWPGSAGVRRKRCLPASLDCALRAAPRVTCRPGRRNGHPDRTKELD